MEQKNIAILITGRGNNTLKDKNVIKILGKPLLQYGAIEGKKIERASSFFISSDDDKILKAGSQCGYITIKRPPEYAQPDSQHVDCLIHALDVMKKDYSVDPDILLVILANCATIKAKWINDCIDILINNPEATSAIPVQKNNDHHPLRAKKIGLEGFLEPFITDTSNKEKLSSNRQDLPANFFVCHNFWGIKFKKYEA